LVHERDDAVLADPLTVEKALQPGPEVRRVGNRSLCDHAALEHEVRPFDAAGEFERAAVRAARVVALDVHRRLEARDLGEPGGRLRSAEADRDPRQRAARRRLAVGDGHLDIEAEQGIGAPGIESEGLRQAGHHPLPGAITPRPRTSSESSLRPRLKRTNSKGVDGASERWAMSWPI